MSQAKQIFGHRESAPTAETSPAPARRTVPSFARNALIVSGAFVLSRILGLGREVILANQFGTGREMDAYVSAFRIPDLLFLVVMAGAFGAAFIPVFGEFITKGDTDRAWRLASAVMTWAGVVVLALCTVSFVLARPLMSIVAPGFDAETMDLAVNLMRILLLSPVFLGLGIAAKGILEAQHLFTLPALAPLVYNAAIIVGAIFFVQDYGIYAVGWAVIIGAIGHLAVQLPGLVITGMRFRPTLSRHVDGLMEVARLLGPRILGLAAFQINFIVVTAFASTSSPEHVAAINYAWQLLMLPHGILALSISTVIFPTLAALYSRGDKSGFRSTLERTMRPLLFLSLPASLGLLLLREPIVQLIFESGNFDASSTALVAAPLAWFAIGLVGYALTEIMTRVFYATRDTKTPVITGILVMIINVILCAFLVVTMEQSGLALALAATTGAEAIILLLFLRRRIGNVVTPSFWPWLLKVVIATAGMVGVILLTVGRLQEALALSGTELILSYALVLYAFTMYATSFFVFALLLRIPELQQILRKLSTRLPGQVQQLMRVAGLI